MINLELLLLWIWINSICAIYYIIKNPFEKDMSKIEIGILAYMLSGTFWLFWIFAKIMKRFSVFTKK